MNLTNGTYIKKISDNFFRNHISKYPSNDSEINIEKTTREFNGERLSFYKERSNRSLQKNDFEVSLYDIDKIVKMMHGSPSEKLFSREMLLDLIEFHMLTRNRLKEKDNVADDIYVMF